MSETTAKGALSLAKPDHDNLLPPDFYKVLLWADQCFVSPSECIWAFEDQHTPDFPWIGACIDWKAAIVDFMNTPLLW